MRKLKLQPVRISEIGHHRMNNGPAYCGAPYPWDLAFENHSPSTGPPSPTTTNGAHACGCAKYGGECSAVIRANSPWRSASAREVRDVTCERSSARDCDDSAPRRLACAYASRTRVIRSRVAWSSTLHCEARID